MNISKAIPILALIVLFVITVFSAHTEQEEPELIPIEVLFGNPTKAIPRLSPDGTRLAYVAPYEDVVNVWIKTIGEDDDHPITKNTDRPVFRYFWAEDNQHILYLKDKEGNENYNLYSVDINTGETRNLTPYEEVRVMVIGHNKFHPDEVLIQMNKRNPQIFDVYKLNIETGEMEMVGKNPALTMDWIADRNLEVRGRIDIKLTGGLSLKVRDSLDSKWRTIKNIKMEDVMNSNIIGFDRDGDTLYGISPMDTNSSKLIEIDTQTGEAEIIGGDPNYDVSTVVTNPDTFEIEGYSIYKAKEEWIFLDDDVKEDFEVLKTIDDGEISISSRNNDDDLWIVSFNEDDGPVAFYLYDRDAQKAEFLFYHRDELNDYTLAEMEPIEFTARDGLTIHGYATFPPGKERENLPMVLLVHGGPWYRDYWGYNPITQALANRGYLVLQVNFRGSTGYGKDFINAGNKEWGGKMQDDLTDAVNWAVDKGWADPNRVAIMGASYGGYASLVGATFTPDLYTCAVSAMGPSNLITFMETLPPYWQLMKPIFYDRIGNPETEVEFMKSRSPLFFVDKIEIPMVLIYGKNDPRVKISEGEQIVEVMKEKDIDYEYYVMEDEGHGVEKKENRIKFIKIAEIFLAKHLGGRCDEYEDIE